MDNFATRPVLTVCDDIISQGLTLPGFSIWGRVEYQNNLVLTEDDVSVIYGALLETRSRKKNEIAAIKAMEAFHHVQTSLSYHAGQLAELERVIQKVQKQKTTTLDG